MTAAPLHAALGTPAPANPSALRVAVGLPLGAVTPSEPIAVVETPEGLAQIRTPGCAAVLWHRPPPPGLLDWLAGLPPERLPAMRAVLHPEDAAAALRTACDAAGTPEGPERARLIADIADLAERFAALMRAPLLQLRLDVVTTDACRRFHIDAVTARLLCTYRGTGTQIGIGPGGREPDPIHTAPTGAVLILRGTLWPTDPPADLRHRSPPIAGTGETRLLLVLDPVWDPEDTA